MTAEYLQILTNRLTKMEKQMGIMGNNARGLSEELTRNRQIQAMALQQTMTQQRNFDFQRNNLGKLLTCSDGSLKITEKDGGLVDICRNEDYNSMRLNKISDDCLLVGTNNLIKLKVDEAGTLNIGSISSQKELNEVDLYSEKINFLSNVNTSSPNSGSIVMYGGLGIMKDLSVGGGILTKTDGGIPTKLDYFEEGTLDVVWDGIWSEKIDSSYIYQRIGHLVTLNIPYTANSAINSGIITNTLETVLPKRLRPNYDIKYTIDGQNEGRNVQCVAVIYGNDGRIKIYPKNGKVYSGNDICGFDTFCISYMSNLREKK
jgi:hypothetical protein